MKCSLLRLEKELQGKGTQLIIVDSRKKMQMKTEQLKLIKCIINSKFKTFLPNKKKI